MPRSLMIMPTKNKPVVGATPVAKLPITIMTMLTRESQRSLRILESFAFSERIQLTDGSNTVVSPRLTAAVIDARKPVYLC